MSRKNEVQSGLSRRLLLAGVGGAAVGLAAPVSAQPALETGTPRRGGTLRIGMTGGGSTDSMDPTRANAAISGVNMYLVYNCLVELEREEKKISPELAESWEVQNGAKRWIFKLRTGVEFHSGKTLDSDDVVYSLMRHVGEKSTSTGAGYFSNVAGIRADGPNSVIVDLIEGDANFPALLTLYMFSIVPKDFSDWKNPIGTGPYMLSTFQPGARFTARRNPRYWKSNRAWFDAVEILVIDDSTARLNALITGRIDAMNRVDRRTVKLLANTSGARILRSPGGLHYTFNMNCRFPEFNNVDARLAMKYSVDREQLLSTVLQGFGTLGNDHPVSSSDPDVNTSIAQRKFDPDRARFHLRKAGLDRLEIELSGSGAAFPEANDAAVLVAESSGKGGVTVRPIREPSDGYFANVVGKKPFYISYYSGEAASVSTFANVYLSTSPQNYTHYSNPEVDKLIRAIRPQTDANRRRELLWDLQQLVHNDGAQLIPVFADFIDAIGPKLMGTGPNANRELDGQRLPERTWFAA